MQVLFAFFETLYYGKVVFLTIFPYFCIIMRVSTHFCHLATTKH